MTGKTNQPMQLLRSVVEKAWHDLRGVCRSLARYYDIERVFLTIQGCLDLVTVVMDVVELSRGWIPETSSDFVHEFPHLDTCGCLSDERRIIDRGIGIGLSGHHDLPLYMLVGLKYPGIRFVMEKAVVSRSG